VGNAFSLPTNYGGYDLGGTLFLTQILLEMSVSLIEGSLSSFQEFVDLDFTYEFAEGLL